MKNIVFEGNTGSGKTTIIKALKKYYDEKGIKVGITNDMDENSPYYKILNDMYNNSANMTLKSNFSIIPLTTLISLVIYFSFLLSSITNSFICCFCKFIIYQF